MILTSFYECNSVLAIETMSLGGVLLCTSNCNLTHAGKLGAVKMSKEAQNKLISYPFPGNVRELKSVVELAAVMCEENEIEAEDITFNSLQKEGQFLFEEMTLRDYTFKIIRHFLDKYDNNVLLVAKKLGIGKSSIYRYLKEMEEG